MKKWYEICKNVSMAVSALFSKDVIPHNEKHYQAANHDEINCEWQGNTSTVKDFKKNPFGFKLTISTCQVNGKAIGITRLEENKHPILPCVGSNDKFIYYNLSRRLEEFKPFYVVSVNKNSYVCVYKVSCPIVGWKVRTETEMVFSSSVNSNQHTTIFKILCTKGLKDVLEESQINELSLSIECLCKIIDGESKIPVYERSTTKKPETKTDQLVMKVVRTKETSSAKKSSQTQAKKSVNA